MKQAPNQRWLGHGYDRSMIGYVAGLRPIHWMVSESSKNTFALRHATMWGRTCIIDTDPNEAAVIHGVAEFRVGLIHFLGNEMHPVRGTFQHPSFGTVLIRYGSDGNIVRRGTQLLHYTKHRVGSRRRFICEGCNRPRKSTGGSTPGARPSLRSAPAFPP